MVEPGKSSARGLLGVSVNLFHSLIVLLSFLKDMETVFVN